MANMYSYYFSQSLDNLAHPANSNQQGSLNITSDDTSPLTPSTIWTEAHKEMKPREKSTCKSELYDTNESPPLSERLNSFTDSSPDSCKNVVNSSSSDEYHYWNIKFV